MKYKPVIAVITLFSFGLTNPQPPIQAQGVFNMGMLTNTLSQDVSAQSERRRAARRRGKSRSSIRYTPQTKSTLGTFRQSAAVRKNYVADFTAKMKAADAKDGAGMQQIFAKQNLFAMVGSKMSKYGLRTNNIADPLAMYIVTAWQGVRGRDSAPNKAQLLGVRSQIARNLAKVPSLNRLSDAEKQQWADSLLIQTFITDLAVKHAKKNPGLMAQSKADITSAARRNIGFDLNVMKLTNEGLEL